MKIILYKDVPNLGEEGDIKVVTNGYARNYLIPQKFAVKYTKSTEIELAQKQQAIARRKKEKTSAASDMKTRLESLVMEIAVAAGDKGKLFGSVTSTSVVDYLHSNGVEVERKKVELPEGGIKTVGAHSVKVKLYGGEEAVLNVTVSAAGDKPAEAAAAPAPAAKVEKPVVEEAIVEAVEEAVVEEALSEEADSEEEER